MDVSDWPASAVRVSRAVTRQAISKRIGQDLVFHAAGLATSDGGVLVLVGPSGTGKTTAAGVLARTLGYVSDETVALRRDGSVGAYPKPLSFVPATAGERKREVSPDDMGLVRPPLALRLARLAVLARDPLHQGPPVIEQLDLLSGISAVAQQTSSLARLDKPLDWLSRVLVTGGPPTRLRYREISDCVPAVQELLTDGDAVVPVCAPHPPSEVLDDLRLDCASARRWSRAPYTDAVEVDGRVLILSSGGLLLLDGVGAAVWLRCRRAATTADLTAVATDRLGPHPDAWRIVEDAVKQLEDRGLLVQATLPLVRDC